MQRSWSFLISVCFGLVVLLLVALPVAALVLLYGAPFESWRRAQAEALLSEALDLQTTVSGPVDIGLGFEPTVSIFGIASVPSDQPSDVKGMTTKNLSFKVSLLKLLRGSADLKSIVVDGLKIDIEIPVDVDGEPQGEDTDYGGVIHDYVRSPFAGDIVLRNSELTYTNRETGFTIRYDFERIGGRPSANGGILIEGTGTINGEALALEGNVEPPGSDSDQRKFTITASHAGLESSLAGTYTKADPADMLEATLTGSAPSLSKFLAIYEIKGELDGNGNLSARLSGPIGSLKMSDLDLKLSFESGDTLQLGGSVADIVTGEGLGLTLSGARAPRAAKEDDEGKPLYDLGITGFSGRIVGSLDTVLVRDLRIVTDSVKAQLHEIGPISAERVWKDPQGRIGLYDVEVLAGDPDHPSLRVAGTIKDVLEFQGVDLEGEIDFETAEFLDLTADKRAAELGHLKGNVVISDADGSLGIEALTAKVVDSSLLSLSIHLVFDDLPKANELKFATHLDIPRFKSFAAALGTDIEQLGAVKFDGTVTGSNEKISATGTTLVGATTIKGTLVGMLSQGRPVLSGDIAVALLHLPDVIKLASIRSVYLANIDEADADIFDYSKVWETLLVDLQIKVAKISGGGHGTSHIGGRVTYQAGIIGLDPLTMTFLGGKASTTGKIVTAGTKNSFVVKGRIDNMQIGSVLRELKVDYPVRGALHVFYDLSGAGNTMAAIPKSLNGTLAVSLHRGWIGTDLLDLTGLSLPAWLLTRASGGNQANLVCMAAPFKFNKGRGVTHGLILETKNVQVVGVGFIDFRNDTIDLRFKPQALHEQFIKIAQPFAIAGTLSKPHLRLTGHPAAGAVTEVLAFPFNLLEAIIQPEGKQPGHVPCHVVHPTAHRRGGGGEIHLGPLKLPFFGGGH